MTSKPPFTDPQLDWYYYVASPRKTALPVPSSGIHDAPLTCIAVNLDWWSHISGVLDILTNQYVWTGTDDDVYRAVKSISDLLKLSEGCVLTCDDVLSCVAVGSASSQQAGGVQAGGDYGAGLNYTIPASDNTVNALAYAVSTGNCGYDNLFAGCVAVSQFIHDQIGDWLGGIALAASAVAAAAAAFGFYPIAVAVAGMSAWVIGAAYAAWSLYVTSAVVEEFACDLFCECYTDCTLTTADITALFESKFQYPITGSTLGTLLNLAITKTTPSDIHAVLMAAAWATVLTGARIGALHGFESITNVIEIGVLDTNSGWAACACDTSWCNYTRFGTLYDGTGAYTVTFGALATDGISGNIPSGNSFRQAALYAYSLPAAAVFTDITYSVNRASADGTPESELYAALYNGGTLLWDYSENNTIIGVHTASIPVPNITGADTLRFQIRGPNGGYVLIESLQIQGTGTAALTNNC